MSPNSDRDPVGRDNREVLKMKSGERGWVHRVHKIEEGKELHQVVLDGGAADDDCHCHRYAAQLCRNERPRVLDFVTLPAA